MTQSKNGRVAICISPKGVDTVTFLNADKKESLNFYKSIEPLVEAFERQVKERFQEKGVSRGK